jgi:hypothetical protein
MVIPQIDVPALRALRLVGAKTGGYHPGCYTQVSDSSIWILVRNFANKR